MSGSLGKERKWKTMSLFFSQISKLSARGNNARLFSSLPQSPCLLLGSKTLRESLEDKTVTHLFFDSAKEETVRSSENKVPKELDGQTLVGASQGWVTSVRNKDLTVHLTDLYKPWMDSSPRVVSLPSLGFKPSTYATEVSLSSSDPVQDQDVTVAAKFSESLLSVCSGSMWTHIETAYSLLLASDLIYSKRDKTFYFTSLKGLYMGSLDLGNKKLNYEKLRLRNSPKIPEADWEVLDQCFMSKHLVESPSGELFFIKWYTHCIPTPYINKADKDSEYEILHGITKRFMVFREDGKSKDFCYTEDIGDLCIFLGKSEAFCVSASMYPGLKPNSVYYIGPGLGSYDLASGTVSPYSLSGAPSLVRAPFWLHPIA